MQIFTLSTKGRVQSVLTSSWQPYFLKIFVQLQTRNVNNINCVYVTTPTYSGCPMRRLRPLNLRVIRSNFTRTENSNDIKWCMWPFITDMRHDSCHSSTSVTWVVCDPHEWHTTPAVFIWNSSGIFNETCNQLMMVVNKVFHGLKA